MYKTRFIIIGLNIYFIDIMAKLLNYPNDVIYFGLLIGLYDYNIITSILYMGYIITTVIKI